MTENPPISLDHRIVFEQRVLRNAGVAAADRVIGNPAVSELGEIFAPLDPAAVIPFVNRSEIPRRDDSMQRDAVGKKFRLVRQIIFEHHCFSLS